MYVVLCGVGRAVKARQRYLASRDIKKISKKKGQKELPFFREPRYWHVDVIVKCNQCVVSDPDVKVFGAMLGDYSTLASADERCFGQWLTTVTFSIEH